MIDHFSSTVTFSIVKVFSKQASAVMFASFHPS